MRRLTALLLSAMAAAGAHGLSLDEVKPVKPGAAAAKVRGLAADGPRPLVYFAPGDVAPSCGLLATAPTGHLLPMVSAGPGERFPACEAVTQAQSFALPQARGHVFSLRQRDTREDVSTVHFFVRESGPDGLQALDALNQAELPARRDLPSLATWAKAQWHAQSDGAAGWAPEPTHGVVAGALFLNLARHAAQARCRATLGQRDTAEPLMVDEWPCAALQAAATSTTGGANWFLVLFSPAGDASASALRVYRVQRGQAQRQPAVESRLAAQAPKGLPAVKAALPRALR